MPTVTPQHKPDESLRMGKLRRLAWLAFALGSGALLLGVGSLWSSKIDAGKRTVDCDQHWQKYAASANDLAAQLSALQQELNQVRASVAALSNRPTVVTQKVSAVRAVNPQHNTEKWELPAPLLFQKATGEDWRVDYERDLRIHPGNEERFSVLPTLGGDHWRAGLMIVPLGPDGVNKQGVQSSSYLFGIKGSLP